MTSEINFSTIKAQETYDRLKRCLDLSEDLLHKLNGHASSKNKVPQNIVKVYGQSETEIINEIDSGIIADEVPEPVESEITDVKKDADDESAVEIELETVTEIQIEEEKNFSEESADEVVIHFTENNDLQSEKAIDLSEDAVSEEESMKQTILSGESTDAPKLATEIDETAEDIVERAIQDALEEKQEKKEPTKADLKENEADQSEFIFQKDHSDEKIDFKNVEKFGKENEEDIKENVENGEDENQASSIADAENEFDKNRRETLADVSEISNLSSSPKSVQESDEISENSENDEIFPVIINETLSEKSEKEADQPEENKIEKSTAAASPIDATSKVAAENGEHKSSNSSFEIIETNDPALVESLKKENKELENDATDALESKNETEEKSAAVFKNVANTIEEKPVPVPAKEAEAAPVHVAEATPVVEKKVEKIEAQTQAEPKIVQSSALPAELAQEAADLQKMAVAEEKISLAEEVKTLPKEEPLNFAKALKTPPVEVKKVIEKVEEENKVEDVKLDDLENEEEDSGNVSEEKSAEESLEKIQAISDECEKAVKRTSTEIEALRAEILRNILIAKELENEKEAASDEKLDIPAENAPTEQSQMNSSQTTNANTPNKKSKKRKNKVQKPKHQKW